MNFKEVTKNEFLEFVGNYPRKLESNFFMDWRDFYDFPDGYKTSGLDDLYLYIVARVFYDVADNKYYIKDNDKKNKKGMEHEYSAKSRMDSVDRRIGR